MQSILSLSSLKRTVSPFFLDGHIEVHQNIFFYFVSPVVVVVGRNQMRPTCPAFVIHLPRVCSSTFVCQVFHHHHHHHSLLIYYMVHHHHHSSTLSIPRALRDRASISPISTPLLNSAGMDFILSIHSLLSTPPPSLEVVIVMPVTDLPADRANRSSLDGPTTSTPASRTMLTSAGPSPNRECSFVVVVVAAAPL